MKFGIHSLLFRETFVEADLPLLDRCRKMGFDAVEIVPFDLRHFPAKRVRQVARDLVSLSSVVDRGIFAVIELGQL